MAEEAKEAKESLVDEKQQMTKQESATPRSIDEMMEIVGGYGKFQIIVTLMFGIMTFPPAFQCLISYFAFNQPRWRCKENSTSCTLNGTHLTTDKTHCLYQRTEWESVEPRTYSIVTQYDLFCEREWFTEFATSSLFMGWFFGSVFIGWWSDKWGRIKPIFISMATVIMLGFASAFMPNIYMFIACRFTIGFFLPGTFQQVMFMYISEIVGGKHRAFAGLSIFFFVNFALLTLALKYYLLASWQYLYIASSVPYTFVLLFYKYLPESMRYLRVKGRLDEALDAFKIVARRNGTTIPAGATVEPYSDFCVKKSSGNFLDLFRTPKIAYITLIQGVTYFVGAMSFYCLYLGAAAISGHALRDFLIITAAEVPVALAVMDFTERFGRKRTVMTTMLIGGVMCVPLGFTPNYGSYKIARVIFGMVGKVSVSAHCNCIQSWSVELYPTNVRGVGMGFLLLMARLGASCAPFANKEFSSIFEGSGFIFIGVFLFIVSFFLCFLPESKGVTISDGQDSKRTLIKDPNTVVVTVE